MTDQETRSGKWHFPKTPFEKKKSGLYDDFPWHDAEGMPVLNWCSIIRPSDFICGADPLGSSYGEGCGHLNELDCHLHETDLGVIEWDVEMLNSGEEPADPLFMRRRYRFRYMTNHSTLNWDDVEGSAIYKETDPSEEPTEWMLRDGWVGTFGYIRDEQKFFTLSRDRFQMGSFEMLLADVAPLTLPSRQKYIKAAIFSDDRF